MNHKKSMPAFCSLLRKKKKKLVYEPQFPAESASLSALLLHFFRLMCFSTQDVSCILCSGLCQITSTSSNASNPVFMQQKPCCACIHRKTSIIFTCH